ncbi:MAG: hypothetical protein HRF49_01995 [bacterium]
MKIGIRRHIEDERLALGIVRAKGLTVRPSSAEFVAKIEQLAADILAGKSGISDDAKSKVRNMLKIDGFSPSGRNRPASEYLLRELERTGKFKYINNVVDINNYISLKTALPISIFDTGKMAGAMVIRTGNVGEAYVFNPEGQIIDVKRMIVCCEEQPDYTSIPFGSPIKDSMYSKVNPGCNQVLGVIYSTPQLYSAPQLESICREMADLLKSEADAAETAIEIR